MRLNVRHLGIFFIVSISLLSASITQVDAEDVPKSKQQISDEVSTDDVICKDGLELVWTYDGKLICVTPESVLKLVRSGWIAPETVDMISISDKTTHEVSENTHVFQFDYCAAVYNTGALGMIISSDIEKIPIQIDPDIQIDQCHQYGTQIHALSESSLKISIFYEYDMQTLFKNFEAKKKNLEDDLVSNQQKLLMLQDPDLEDDENLEELNKVKWKNKWISIAIQSYRDGLDTLRSLQ